MHNIAQVSNPCQEGISENERFVREVFTKTPWQTEKGLVTDINAVPDAIRNPKCTDEGYQLACKKRDEVVAAYNKNRVDAERISDKRLIELIDVCPESTVYIMADSVIASKQKEHRNVNGVTGTTRDKKTVNVANVYILSKEGVCYITAQTEEDALKMALAYVVHHDMLSNRELVFFADGANTIKNNAKKYFGFRKYDYILDWYHLRKKCYELFTMALSGGKKNKERKAKIRYGFEKILWAGNTEEASAYLDSLKTMEGVVKSDYYLGEIKKYISEEKKGDSITSYALRSELEMVNSSSRCEKQNDLEFADRCKNNGMSWSDDGSIAIAQVTNLFLNHEDQTGSDPNGKTWFQTHEARYEPTPLSEEMKVYMHLAS